MHRGGGSQEASPNVAGNRTQEDGVVSVQSAGDDGADAADESQYVAQVTKSGGDIAFYAAISDALKEIRTNGGTLKLLQDQTFTVDQSLKSGVEATIDLNGHRLVAATTSSSAWAIAVKSGAKLTLTDTSEAKTGVLGKGSVRRFISVEGELNLQEGAIDNDFATCSKSSVEVKGASAIFNINGGSVRYSANNASYSAVSIANGTVNLNSGSIESKNGTAVNITGAAAFNMNDGIVKGAKYGISVTNVGATATLNAGSVNTVALGNGTLVFGDSSSKNGPSVGSMTVANASYVPTVTLNAGSLGTFSSVNGNFKFSEESAFSSMIFSDETVADWLPGGNKLIKSGDVYVVQGDTLDAAVELQRGNGSESKQYASMSEAFSAFQSGDTFKLLQNVDLSNNAGLTIKGAYNNKIDATIDLNGFSIKVANNDTSNIRVEYATLTIRDGSAGAQGRIYSESTYEQSVTDKALVSAVGGTVILESGTIDAATAFNDSKTQGQNAIGVYWSGDPGRVIVNGGVIKAGWYCIAGNGSDASNPDNDKAHASTSVVVNGGSLISAADYAIYNPQIGSVEINNGDICGEAGGVLLNRGSLTVSGGSIASKGASLVDISGDGTSGAVAAVINVNAKYGDTSATITGGKFVADGDASVLTTGTDHKATIAVSGGEFSQAVLKSYCAEGYIPTSSTDEQGAVAYGVMKAPVQIVDMDGNYVSSYATVQEAADALKMEQTIKLMADISESVVVDSGKVVILDLNGKTLSAADSVPFKVYGILHIDDETAVNPTVAGSDVSGYAGGKVVSEGHVVETYSGGQFSLHGGMLESTAGDAVLAQGNINGASSGKDASVAIQAGYVLAQKSALVALGDGAKVGVGHSVSGLDNAVLESKDGAVVSGRGTVEPGIDYGNTEISIYGGNLVGHNQMSGYIACGIYHPQRGRLYIGGGSIFADGGVGVLLRAGQATIAGGTIQGTGDVSGKVGDSPLPSRCYGLHADGRLMDSEATSGYLLVGIYGVTSKIFAGSNEIPAIALDNDETNVSARGELTAYSGIYSSDVTEYAGYGTVCVPTSDGNYMVVAKGEESTKAPSSGTGAVSGSVAISGPMNISQEDQKQIADSAASTAESLRNGISIDSEIGTAKIGGVTVDANDENADAIKAVNEAAMEGSSSVDVRLVVKSELKDVSDNKIEQQAKATDAAIIPFALSVDMVTKVTKSDQTLVSATVPVKEVSEPIRVKVTVDKDSLWSNGAKKSVVVARLHDNVVELITPEDVNYDTGEVVFKTDKFSEYAVLTSEPDQSYEIADFIDENGDKKTIDNSQFNVGSDYAFAGWYMDKDFNSPCDASYQSGKAYPKFVKVSDLITFEGGSLRMDVVDPSKATYLRFGYHIVVPTGSRYLSNGWNYYTDYSTNPKYLAAYNNLAYENGTAMSNLVLADVPYTGYQTKTYSQMVLRYKTADGTTVEVTDSVRVRSVREVADMIVNNPIAPEDQVSLAKQIIAACENN